MKPMVHVPLLLVALSAPVASQEVPKGFPLDRSFRGVSINGFDVQRQGLTLTIARDAKSERLVGSGSGGCNTWTATVYFREGRMDVVDIVTTRRACPKARMVTEQAFLTTLRMTQSWKVDGNRLVLEGESGRLLLTSTAPAKTKTKTKAK